MDHNAGSGRAATTRLHQLHQFSGPSATGRSPAGIEFRQLAGHNAPLWEKPGFHSPRRSWSRCMAGSFAPTSSPAATASSPAPPGRMRSPPPLCVSRRPSSRGSTRGLPNPTRMSAAIPSTTSASLERCRRSIEGTSANRCSPRSFEGFSGLLPTRTSPSASPRRRCPRSVCS